MSFPSPCITSTRQLTDQSSTSHPSSPPSHSPAQPPPASAQPGDADPSIAMLKQYYLDCILKIDPNHPVGQTFQKVSHIENKHKVVNNSANILLDAVDQKFSFDLINQWMIKVLTIMCYVPQETGGRVASAGARQRDRARHRRPSSGQGGIKNPEFKRVREDLSLMTSV